MQQLQDEFIEPSSPLVDNYNILAPTRKNTENALVSLSQMQQLQQQQQQQQQSTCQCGACQNLNVILFGIGIDTINFNLMNAH
jgi:membrane protease subunit (stomatin/prohibitin family)